ncbi:MDR/SDR family oxidoreductase [Aspergillus vadensis CBS 113365]|uniref:KR-domain-containing protein n=1 Tax=Aspergillus vadensis (strain CBS 113365 / IMI 142717 / IBT 24658) TaxID=1448311 RepID=A0A319BB03_ASPVC|nr:KR-domain-containing protein [Aspergillus vadensis CBS 113365]PYH70166.1 KR-domain-containing protein [Aspergillus vadensis CBS 113365]
MIQNILQPPLQELDTEYIVQDGRFLNPRVFDCAPLEQEVSMQTVGELECEQRFGQAELHLDSAHSSISEGFRFIEAEPIDCLGDMDVELEIHATGLNFRDVLTSLGQIPNAVAWKECAGVVTKVGSKCSKFKPGDRIAGIAPASFQARTRFREDTPTPIVHIPSGMSLAAASGIATNFLTAWYSLTDVARIQTGESVLIHSGAGGTGQALIQLAVHCGAEVYTTAPYGRFVKLGLKDILENAKLPMAQFRNNVTYRFFDLSLVLRDRQLHVRAALEAVMRLMGEGKLHPQEPTLVYGVSELEKAYRHMQSGKNLGKIVIEMRHTDIVKTVIKSRPNSSFASNATYLIAGGLGGLGQSKDANSRKYLDQMKGEGVNVQVYACDVAEEGELSTALTDAARHMPPIRGCVANAFNQDVGFESMSHDDWQAAVRPKAQGSWNLHKLLPHGLDFFLMLASMNGVVGHIGQANYAAGNTFQDALAHHRKRCGENAATLDLGLFTFAGRVARDPKLLKIMLSILPHKPITETEFHALLDVYCNPVVCKEKGLPCQVSFGMRPQDEGTALKAYWVGKPMFRYVAQQRLSEGQRERQGQSIDLPAAFRGAESLADATAAVIKALTTKLARTLSVEEDNLNEHKALHQYGVDSLVAVELRTWFAKELQAEVATFDIIGRATITSLAGVAASRSKLPRGWS